MYVSCWVNAPLTSRLVLLRLLERCSPFHALHCASDNDFAWNVLWRGINTESNWLPTRCSWLRCDDYERGEHPFLLRLCSHRTDWADSIHGTHDEERSQWAERQAAQAGGAANGILLAGGQGCRTAEERAAPQEADPRGLRERDASTPAERTSDWIGWHRFALQALVLDWRIEGLDCDMFYFLILLEICWVAMHVWWILQVQFASSLEKETQYLFLSDWCHGWYAT